MNESEIDILTSAYHNSYTMVKPTDKDALRLRRNKYIDFDDKPGKYGYARALITETGTLAFEGIKHEDQ